MTFPSDPPPSHPASPKPGQVLAGKYRVERVLGVGGMGIVVAAHHLELDERVAVKLMLPDALGSKEAVARFMREAKAAVKIKSEHIARVSDVGRLETGEPYLVMEYLEGTDLDGWLRTRGVLAVEQAAEFVIQACEALAEAHALGIVHRDLKPANLFCVRRADGLLSIKILHFGISKAAQGAAGSDFQGTKTRAVMGSPLYMSPEQLDSPRNVDQRGDIWALGAVLYELVSGEPPFMAESLTGLVLRITQQEPLPLRNLRPDLPAALEPVILRCLRKDRADRYQNVAELVLALAELAPRRALASVERVQRIVETAGASQSVLEPPPSSLRTDARSARSEAELLPTLAASQLATQSSFGQTGSSKRGPSRALYGALGLVGLAALAGGALWLRHGPSTPSPEPPLVASVPPARASAPAAVSLEPLVAAAVAPPPASAAEPAASTSSPKSPAKKASPGKPAALPARPNAGHSPKTLDGLIEDRQ